MDDPALELPILVQVYALARFVDSFRINQNLAGQNQRLGSSREPVDAQQATNPAFDELPYGNYLSTNSKSVISPQLFLWDWDDQRITNSLPN